MFGKALNYQITYILFFFFSGTVQNPENPNALMINPAQTLMLVQALQKVKETASKVGTGT